MSVSISQVLLEHRHSDSLLDIMAELSRWTDLDAWKVGNIYHLVFYRKFADLVLGDKTTSFLNGSWFQTCASLLVWPLTCPQF